MDREIPFVFGVPAKGSNFTDRTQETKRLVANFTYGINTILISPRRWGKTSLVRKAAGTIAEKDIVVVYMDIFACHSEWDFYYAYSSSILKQTSSKIEEWIEMGKKFLARMMPKFSFSVDPVNDFTISFDINNNSTEDRDELLQLPEKIAKEKGIRIIVCIDEFQQISEFKDSLIFQKRLRSVWQHFDNVSFCLFGSKRHMMNALFDTSSKPFYKFGDIINLERIPVDDWVLYITKKFKDSDKSISDGQCRRICQLVDLNSSYVQQLSWIVWTICDDLVTDQDIDNAYQLILDQNSALFEKQIETLSSSQLNYLRAMADGMQSGFSRKEIVDKYNLGSSANVSTIQKALQHKEIIFIENKISYFCDPLLLPWIKRRAI